MSCARRVRVQPSSSGARRPRRPSRRTAEKRSGLTRSLIIGGAVRGSRLPSRSGGPKGRPAARGVFAAGLPLPRHFDGAPRRCRGRVAQTRNRNGPGARCQAGSRRGIVPKAEGYDDQVVKRVLLASPRGYCAGVERAVETVELALEHYGAPIYVRKQIVHNAHVVRDLEERGAVFVESEEEAPEGSTIVFSAHGVAPSVHVGAARRRLQTIDATCPLVTKVHVQARRYAAEGYTVVLVGHAGHEEVVGTMGEAPESMVLVESVAQAEAVDLDAEAKVAYVTQTTLSVDETAEIIGTLRRRYPHIRAPRREDICYATSNRQWAVKELLAVVDLLLVIGSQNSSNSNRLVDVARAAGVAAQLIDDETEIREGWLQGVEVVGITSGASAPEKLVTRVCDWFRARGVSAIEQFRSVDEDVTFRLPVELRRELALAERQ
ncbi:MAG: 4-hydroxy-3-methylbut-2-enyl diphosphate reductase [Actinobacteria bacterium]|nr:4-hydroxy-3-methylbut-2-enyl diphosphate reductase [Actinomycetota bacterium]